MEHAAPSVGPSYRFHSNGWLVLLTIGLAIQFIVAAAAMVSHQLADSNTADLIEIARACNETNQCATKGGAGRLGLFSGASWERLLAFSLRSGGGLALMQHIQLGMLIAAMATTFLVLLRYLDMRAAVLSIGLYLPLAFSVTEFRTLECPNATPLPAALYWAAIILFVEFRLLIFAVLASFALAASATVYILFLVALPFHLVVVALWARRPLLGTAACCLAFLIPFCLDSLGAARAAAENVLARSAIPLGLGAAGALFTMAVRRLRRIHVLASMSPAARVRTVLTAALLYLTITVWVASLVFGLPMPPESRYFAPAIFPLLFLASASATTVGPRAFVLFVLAEAVALLLLPFAPQAPLSGRSPLVLVMLVLAVTTAVRVIVRRGTFFQPSSLFAAVLLLAFAIGVTVPDIMRPSGAEKHAFHLSEGERVVSALYAEGYTYPELFASLHGPAADTVLALVASLDPNLFGRPAFPVEPDFSLLLLKTPHAAAARTKGLVAVVPVDRLRTAIVVREDRSFVDWPHAVICRTARGQPSTPRDCIRMLPDAPLLHIGSYVAIGTLDSPPSDSRLRGEEHFDRPSWRWPEPRDGARPDGNTPPALYVTVPVRTPGRGIPHILRGGGVMPEETWRIWNVDHVEFEGDLPGSQIRFPDTGASSGVIDVEVRGIGDHPPWEWLRHFIEVTEENAHLLEQEDQTT